MTHTITLTPLLEGARAREKALIDAVVIEADYVSLDSPKAAGVAALPSACGDATGDTDATPKIAVGDA